MERKYRYEISGITTNAPCEAPAMHGRYVCKGIADSVLRTFVLVAFFTTHVCRRLRVCVFALLCTQILFALPEAFLNAHWIAINLCAQVLFALSGAFLRV